MTIRACFTLGCLLTAILYAPSGRAEMEASPVKFDFSPLFYDREKLEDVGDGSLGPA
jgi:hypothetical protein